MTQDQCINQAIGRIGRIGRRIDRAVLAGFAVEALEPFIKRDQTMVDGKGYAEKFNPETFTSETVAVQLHRPRQVAPYNYGPQDVLWLEREIRRRAGL